MRGTRENESEYILELRTEICVDKRYTKVDCDGIPKRYIGKSIGKSFKKVSPYLLRHRV